MAPAYDWLPWLLALTVLLVVGLSGLLCKEMARAATRPLIELDAAAGRIAKGDFGVRTPVRSRDEVGRLAATFNAMAAAHKYRRMFIAVEACEGGVLGAGINAPGAFLLSAASPIEDSLSANYDPSLDTWLADEFSFEYWKAAQPVTKTVANVYQRVYLDVDGSHPSAYGPQFGNPAAVQVGDFLSS